MTSDSVMVWCDNYARVHHLSGSMTEMTACWEAGVMPTEP